MPDKYPNYATLARHEEAGIDYRILIRKGQDRFAIVAPHGGGIEPGTSEIAEAAAGDEWSFYAFEGLKSSGNADLHITSTRFDEPMCLALLRQSRVVFTIHGEGGADELVYLGGLNKPWAARIGAALRARGFDVARHPDPDLQGLEPRNLCNRGLIRKGVQLELSRGLREALFLSLTRQGRQCPTRRFGRFVSALRSVLV